MPRKTTIKILNKCESSSQTRNTNLSCLKLNWKKRNNSTTIFWFIHFRISPRFYNLNLIQPYHRGVPSNLGSILKRRVFSKIIGFKRTWMGQNTCNFITEFGVIFIFAKIEGCGQKNIREIKILFDNSLIVTCCRSK